MYNLTRHTTISRHALGNSERRAVDVTGSSRSTVRLPTAVASDILSATPGHKEFAQPATTNDVALEDIVSISAGPPYSYKDYKPLPTVIYSRHDGEANQLADSLKGYTFYVFSRYSA